MSSHNWTIEEITRVIANAHGLISRAIANGEPAYEAQAYLHYFLGWNMNDIDNPVDIDDLLAQYHDSPVVPFQQAIALEYLVGDFDGYLYPEDMPNAMYARWASPFGWVLLTVYLPVQGDWREGDEVVAYMGQADHERLLDLAYHYHLN